MTTLLDFWVAYPLWVWLGVGAVFLATEVATGSGYLLWPAAAAAVMGVMSLFVHLGLGGEMAVFAGLTIVSTLLARRFVPRRKDASPDINDQTARLLGKSGEAASDFSDGKGRVLVDGAEWWAELDGDEIPAVGGRIEVTAVLGGTRLKVRAG